MALELNNVGIYFAENYLTLQDAVNAIPSKGGTLILSAKDYILNSKLIIDKPITVIGQGSGNNTTPVYVTQLGTTSPTIDMIEFAAPNISLKNLGLINTNSLPTSGSGIKVTSGITSTGTPTEYPGGFRIDNVQVLGFYDNINIINSYIWSINNLVSYKAVRNGVFISNEQLPDGGDSCISNSWIFAYGRNSEAGIKQVSSGGLKIMNTKFNSTPNQTHKQNFSYDGTMNGNVSAILCFSNCSFENFNVAAIKASNFGYVSVNGCEFAPYKGTAIHCIDFNAVDTGAIIGNTFALSGSENGIRVQNSQNITLLNAYKNTGTGVNVTQLGNTNFLNLNP